MATTQILGTSGYKTALGVGKESTFGTFTTPTTYIAVDDHNLNAANQLLTRQQVRKSKGMPAPGVGTVEVKGDITVPADPDVAGFLGGAALGADTVTAGASGNYIHTIKLCQPTQALNSYSFSADNGLGTIQQYLGCKIDTLALSCKAREYLEIKASVMGQTVLNASGSLSPTFSAYNPFEFAHLGVVAGGSSLLNGVSVNVKDFTITLKNNLKEHWASTGGRFLVGIDETTAMVTGSMTIEYVSDAVNQILWGNTTGPAAGAIAQVPLSLVFTQPAVGGIVPQLTITLPKITLTDAPIAIKRSDVLSYAIKFQANESVLGAADDLTLIVQNSVSTAYAP